MTLGRPRERTVSVGEKLAAKEAKQSGIHKEAQDRRQLTRARTHTCAHARTPARVLLYSDTPSSPLGHPCSRPLRRRTDAGLCRQPSCCPPSPPHWSGRGPGRLPSTPGSSFHEPLLIPISVHQRASARFHSMQARFLLGSCSIESCLCQPGAGGSLLGSARCRLWWEILCQIGPGINTCGLIARSAGTVGNRRGWRIDVLPGQFSVDVDSFL